jgi:hypothetical protein
MSVDVRPRWQALLPKGRTEPVDELRLYADDPDGFIRGARVTSGTEPVTA